MPLWPVVSHALVFGAGLSVVLAGLLLAVLRLNPEILLNDYPPDIRAKHGPMSERARRQRRPVTLLFLAAVVVMVTLSFQGVRRDEAGGIAFLTAFVHLFVMFSVFNVVDLLAIDIPLVAIGPRFAVLPGTEGLPGYKDYGFHVRAFLKGTFGILVLSGVIAGVVAASV